MRFDCLRVEVWRADSESRRRESWEMRLSRWSKREVRSASVDCSSEEGFSERVWEDVYWERVWKCVSDWDSRVRIC